MKIKLLKIGLLLISILSLISISFSNEVEEVLKGKNSHNLRISIKNMPADIQKKAIKLLLEENGDSVMSQATKIIMESSDPSISAYTKIIIADYYLLNNNFINAQIQLDEAKQIFPEIRRIKYYKLISSRILNILDKTDPEKAEKNIPYFILNDNVIQEKETDKIEPIPQKEIYHIQVGAFSRLSSAKQLAAFYLKNGYDVGIVEKQTTDKILFIVHIGNYNFYSEAMESLKIFIDNFQTDGFIIKDEK